MVFRTIRLEVLAPTRRTSQEHGNMLRSRDVSFKDGWMDG